VHYLLLGLWGGVDFLLLGIHLRRDKLGIGQVR
jgi:hypothetical protein